MKTLQTYDFSVVHNLMVVGLCKRFNRHADFPWLEVSKDKDGSLRVKVKDDLYSGAGQLLDEYARSMRQHHNINAWNFTYELID